MLVRIVLKNCSVEAVPYSFTHEATWYVVLRGALKATPKKGMLLVISNPLLLDCCKTLK